MSTAKTSQTTRFTSYFLLLTFFFSLLTACQPASAPTPDMSSALTRAFQTAFAQLQPTGTPIPSETPIPSATALLTPPTLPATFAAPLLNKMDTPHTYVKDTCQYLHDKWSSNNATPG